MLGSGGWSKGPIMCPWVISVSTSFCTMNWISTKYEVCNSDCLALWLVWLYDGGLHWTASYEKELNLFAGSFDMGTPSLEIGMLIFGVISVAMTLIPVPAVLSATISSVFLLFRLSFPFWPWKHENLCLPFWPWKHENLCLPWLWLFWRLELLLFFRLWGLNFTSSNIYQIGSGLESKASRGGTNTETCNCTPAFRDW